MDFVESILKIKQNATTDFVDRPLSMKLCILQLLFFLNHSFSQPTSINIFCSMIKNLSNILLMDLTR